MEGVLASFEASRVFHPRFGGENLREKGTHWKGKVYSVTLKTNFLGTRKHCRSIICSHFVPKSTYHISTPGKYMVYTYTALYYICTLYLPEAIYIEVENTFTTILVHVPHFLTYRKKKVP